MSNTKQPPAELVEKFVPILERPSRSTNSIDCAQIAVKYAEEENRELRKCIESLILKHEIYIISNEDIAKAKQLLNKNEDGKR